MPIAGGRLILGYGAGWYEQEYEAYGYEYPGIRTRLEQLEEGLEILKRMWTEESPTFHGVHYHVENARCWPKPVRKPHPPLLIGGGGEKVLLKLVARYADIWNNLGMFHGQIDEKLAVLRAHCEKVNRNFDDIEHRRASKQHRAPRTCKANSGSPAHRSGAPGDRFPGGGANEDVRVPARRTR